MGFKKYIIYALIAGVVISLGSFGINKFINTIEDTAYDKGYETARAEQSTAIVDEGKRHDGIKYELRTLDDVDLIDRYCKWVYDLPHSECVEAIRIIK